MNKLIIIGSDDYNTLGCVRCFGEKELPFILLLVSAKRHNIVVKSHFVKDYICVSSEKNVIFYLTEHSIEWNGAILIPTSDKVESVLDLNYTKLKEYYSLPHSKNDGEVTRMMDKEVQVELANKSGLKVPQTVRYQRSEAIPDIDFFPVIVKQGNSISGKRKTMRVCNSKEELKGTIKYMSETTEFLIQQYVNREYDLLLIGCRMRDGSVWLPAVFKKERWMMKGGDGSFGIISTCVDEYFSQLEKVRKLLNKMDYFGPFSIEFGVDKSGIPFFYEINMRNDGTSHYFYHAGVFVPYIYYLDSVGKLKTEELEIEEQNYCFIDEFGDMRNLTTKDLSFKKWLHDIKGAKSYKYYYSGDNAPFWFMAPCFIIKSLIRMIIK